MRVFMFSTLIFSALSASAAPVAAPVVVRGPAVATSKWVVEFENERCTAGRAYSDGGNEIAIGFQPLPTTDRAYLIVQVPKKVQGLGTWKARVSMGGTEWSDKTPLVVASTKAGFARFNVSVGRQELDRLVTNPDLRIEIDKSPPIHVRLANFSQVMKTLKGCESGLLADWGLPLEAQKSLMSFPSPKGNYFRHTDYPSRAVDRSAVGAIEARVTVGTDGKARDCHITQSSGHKDLDAATCANYLKRARFEPARDHSGRPMVSPYVYRVTWRVE